ncbi:MAG: DUF2085 domain-containing protein [Acidobacteriota bacterium]|nr:DUF2085 domain-containing protein [Acidobacteriota bacterium]
MLLAAAIVAASSLWLALLAFAAAYRMTDVALVSDFIYRVAAFVCHQQADRSFAWNGVPWPVCARCLGLYVAAPAAAVMAMTASGGGRPHSSRRNLVILCASALPTAISWSAEWLAGVPVSNTTRFISAWPLGAGVAWVVIRTALDAPRQHVSRYTLRDARRGPTQ